MCLQSQQDLEDLDDEDEVKKLAHHWSDEEFETNFTEQGYEADTETNVHDDWHKGNCHCQTYLHRADTATFVMTGTKVAVPGQLI